MPQGPCCTVSVALPKRSLSSVLQGPYLLRLARENDICPLEKERAVVAVETKIGFTRVCWPPHETNSSVVVNDRRRVHALWLEICFLPTMVGT